MILAGQEYTAKLTGKEETYNYKLTIPANITKADNKSIVIKISEPGTFYIDDIRVVEDTLIQINIINAYTMFLCNLLSTNSSHRNT